MHGVGCSRIALREVSYIIRKVKNLLIKTAVVEENIAMQLSMIEKEFLLDVPGALTLQKVNLTRKFPCHFTCHVVPVEGS